MAVTVKKVQLWRGTVPDKPGTLADVLEPVAEAKASLRVVLAYGLGDSGRCAVEVFPITGKSAAAAAASVGLAAATTPCLLVEGDDRARLGADMARAIAAAGVNISFVVAEVVGRKFSAVFGFRSDVDAATAAKAIKSAAKSRQR
jgi:hypothetical protein